MRTLSLFIIRGNVRPLLGCLVIFTMLALVSVPLQSTITEGKNLQDASETTQAILNNDCWNDSRTASASSLVIATGPLLPQRPPLDFDGDGKTDYAVVRNVGGTLNWYIQRSTAGFLGQAWGAFATDELVPADYDGDGKWDIAVWRNGTPGTFFILQSATNTLRIVVFGTAGDDSRVTQDFDGDGLADPAVSRTAGGVITWYVLRSSLGFTAATFGVSAMDISIRGDYDGDRKADYAVYRFTTSTFYVLRSSDGVLQSTTFGNSASDYRVPADFDGDGKTDIVVWRGIGAGTPGTWYWLQSSDGAFKSLNFGAGGVDKPVPGDYDGDGKSDQAVWRPGTPSNFYVNRSMSGFFSLPFGISTDIQPSTNLQTR